MYRILIQAMLAAALLGLGLDLTSTVRGGTGDRIQMLRSASLRVVRVDWKPISMFPKEAKRFASKVSSSAR